MSDGDSPSGDRPVRSAGTPDLSHMSIFLSAPFSQWLMPDKMRVDSRREDVLERLRVYLLSCGAAVFSPHHNESWGEKWLDADACTSADFSAMRHADLVCAVLGNPVSTGVAVELGWASAMGKSAVLIVEPTAKLPPLIEGLHAIASCVTLLEPDDWGAEFFEAVSCGVLHTMRDRADSEKFDLERLRGLGYVVLV